MSRYYAGYMVGKVHTFAIFRATEKPTQASHGAEYTHCTGPYPTRANAELNTRRYSSAKIVHVDRRKAR